MVARWPGDELVAAYLGAGSLQEPPEELSQLPVVDGSIEIPAGTGTRQVLLAYARLTGQNVKRAAFGAEGPVLDHYSAAAARQHLRHVGDPLLDAVPGHLLGSVFCDSLEVYGSDWTPDLLGEFRSRRGYDPLPRAVPAGRRRSGRDATARRTTTGPWRSCTRITSSRCSSAGRPGAASRSGSRATARRRP